MAVRVSKPPVNIREKLSELERPIGLKGSELMRAETPQEAFSLIGAGRKNLLINGDMRIDQRNSGSAVTRTTAQPTLYAIDRWIDYIDGGSYSLQRVADAPAGFLNSLKVTTLTSTSNAVIIQQYIEGVNSSVLSYGTSSAKHSTLSFWVKSSVAGKFSGHIGNPNLASLRSFVFTYRINATNTWEYKTITIPGETTGVWINTTSSGLKVLFNLSSAGLSATENAWSNGDFIKTTDSIGVISTTNATWQITGVQLEEGKVATPFECRSYGEELALCERYFQTLEISGNSYGAQYSSVSPGFFYGHPLPLKTRMRIAPISITYSGVSGNPYWVQVSQAAYSAVSTSGITFEATDDTVRMLQQRVSGNSTPVENNYYIWEPRFKILISSEL